VISASEDSGYVQVCISPDLIIDPVAPLELVLEMSPIYEDEITFVGKN